MIFAICGEVRSSWIVLWLAMVLLLKLNSPSLILESSWLRPAAWISTSTSPSRSCGSGMSPNRRSPLFLYRSRMKTHDLLLSVVLLSVGRDGTAAAANVTGSAGRLKLRRQHAPAILWRRRHGAWRH